MPVEDDFDEPDVYDLFAADSDDDLDGPTGLDPDTEVDAGIDAEDEI